MYERTAMSWNSNSMSSEPREASLRSSVSLSSSSGSGAQDDWIFDSDREASDCTLQSSGRRKSTIMNHTPQSLSQQRRQNPAKGRRRSISCEKLNNGDAGTSKVDEMSKSASKTRSTVTGRTMGHRETRSIVDRLEKENFDLKLRITLQEERMARMTAELDDALALSKQVDELRRERDCLRAETAESLEMNEQLVRELEQRDFAVEEAAGIIQEMEERMEDVQRALAEGENEWRKQRLQWQVEGHQTRSWKSGRGFDTDNDAKPGKNETRELPTTTRHDVEYSRPSTAVHDSDYFSAESSPTRSLPMQQLQQQQQQRELRPLSSYIRLLGQPSTASLISEFSMTERSIMSFRSDAVDNGSDSVGDTGSRSTKERNGPVPAPTAAIATAPQLSHAAANTTQPYGLKDRSDQTRDELDFTPTVQKADLVAQHSLPDVLHSSSHESCFEENNGEEENRMEKTVTLDQAVTLQSRSDDCAIDSENSSRHHLQNSYQHPPRKFGRSQSMRVVGSRADIRGDFQKGDMQRAGQQDVHHEYRTARRRLPQEQQQQQCRQSLQHQQRRLHHRTNQFADAVGVSIPDARLMPADAITNVTAEKLSVSGLMPSQLVDRQQQHPQHPQKLHYQPQKSPHRRSIPFSSFLSLSGRPGLDLKRECDDAKVSVDGSRSDSYKDVKVAAVKGSSRKEKARFHLTSDGDEKKIPCSPYASFLAAAASLKAFTNITNAASARLARAGVAGVKPGGSSMMGKPGAVGSAETKASSRDAMASCASAEHYELNSGKRSYDAAADNDCKQKGFIERPARPARPRANTTSNITSICSAGQALAPASISTDAATATPQVSNAPARTLTISTPTTNKQRYLILQGHQRTSFQHQSRQSQASQRSCPTSRSTNAQDDLADRDPGPGPDPVLGNTPDGKSARPTIKSMNSDKHGKSSRNDDNKKPKAHARSRPLPLTPQRSPTVENLTAPLTLPPSSSLASSPPSPTPTNASDPTESTCSFNVEAWGGPPTYKALPREGTWVGMGMRMGMGSVVEDGGTGVKRGQVTLGPPPRNMFFDGSDL